MGSGISTVTQGKGSLLSTRGKNAVVKPFGDRPGSIKEAGSDSMGGLSHWQHRLLVIPLHDPMQGPQV